VHFYADLASIQRELPPDLETVMPLDAFGGLDLSPVREKWGLENCTVINSPPFAMSSSLNCNITACVPHTMERV